MIFCSSAVQAKRLGAAIATLCDADVMGGEDAAPRPIADASSRCALTLARRYCMKSVLRRSMRRSSRVDRHRCRRAVERPLFHTADGPITRGKSTFSGLAPARLFARRSSRLESTTERKQK